MKVRSQKQFSIGFVVCCAFCKSERKSVAIVEGREEEEEEQEANVFEEGITPIPFAKKKK